MTGWLERLDELATAGLFPTWDNARLTCGAMRATGLRSRRGWALVFERVAYVRGEGAIGRDTFAFGPAVTEPGLQRGTTWLVPEDELRARPDDRTVCSRLTGRVVRWPPRRGAGAPRVEWRAEVLPKTATVRVLGRAVTVPLRVPALGRVRLRRPTLLDRVLPEEAVLHQLCARLPRARLFAGAGALARGLRLPRARVLFELDDWQHPAAEAPASSSPDLVALVAALEAGRAPGPLSGAPNGDFRCWLDVLLPLRPAADAREWRPGKAPARPPLARAKAPERTRRGPAAPGRTRERATAPGATRGGAASAPAVEAAAGWLAEPACTPTPGIGCGLIRATGLAATHGTAVCLEAIVAYRRTIVRSTWAWGSGVKAPTSTGVVLGANVELCGHDALFDVVDQRAGTLVLRCRHRPGETVRVKVLGRPVGLVLAVPRCAAIADPVAAAARLTPTEALLYALCAALPPDELFAPPGALGRLLGMGPRARVLFRFADWQQPRAGRPLASSPDLVAMAAAVAAQAPLARLPGKADGDWRCGIAGRLEHARVSDARDWTKEVAQLR